MKGFLFSGIASQGGNGATLRKLLPICNYYNSSPPNWQENNPGFLVTESPKNRE
jgi:hypothetical protein